VRAALADAPNARLRLVEVPEPEAPPHGAIVRVRASGVCRSDWHAWVGHDPSVRFPHVHGHEFAGEVVAVGGEVRTFRGGERVTAPFCCGCGRCGTCAEGQQQLCEREYQPGFDGWGSFAELVMVPWADVNLARLPDDLDFDVAASLGCRFMTAFRGLVDQAQVRPGERVLVIGCGGVGLSSVMIAAALGAHVIAVDIDEAKLELAGRFGAATLIDARSEDPVERARAVADGGVDVAVDALGSARTCAQGIRSLRRRGRHLQLGLLLGRDADPPIPMQDVIRRELRLIGSHGMPARGYPALFRFVHDRALPLDALVGARADLAEAGDALASMASFAPLGVTILRP
jgi:alcohol dehydrogenase